MTNTHFHVVYEKRLQAFRAQIALYNGINIFYYIYNTVNNLLFIKYNFFFTSLSVFVIPYIVYRMMMIDGGGVYLFTFV